MKTEVYKNFQELVYSGKLTNKQFAETSIVNYDVLSPMQNELYKKVMFGLSIYEPAQLYEMNSAKKNKIVRKHKEAQETLNIWKQELTNQWTNVFLKNLFPKSKLVDDMVNDNSTSKSFMNTISFKELHITKQDIINKLIQTNILPYNFATL
jgi:hypothetical protein